LEIKELISQPGISLVSYTASNEFKAEEFIRYLKFESNNYTTFEEILKSLKTKKNTKIHISTPLTIISSLKNDTQYALISKFVRTLGYLCQSNNLSVIIKSYRYNTLGNHRITSISGGSSPIYASNVVVVVDNNRLIVEKSRYSETKEYDLGHILLRSLREKKLKNIEKNKTY